MSTTAHATPASSSHALNHTHRTRRLATRAVAVAVAATAAFAATAGSASATWSVVGTDPATGQVGAAVASCSDVRDLTETMALVPKVGGAVSVGGADTTPLLLASALRSGSAPKEATAAVAAAAGSNAAVGQYGVAVTGSGATTSTGTDVAGTSGARISADGTASVQGNRLASAAVLDATARTFDTTKGDLGDRLVAALNAGAAAGGDRGCAGRPRAASVVVLGTGSALFVPAATAGPAADASDLIGSADITPEQLAAQLTDRSVRTAPRGARAPELYLSAVVPTSGNALSVIDARFAAINAAEARSPANSVSEIVVDPAYSEGLTIAAMILFTVIGLVIAALIITGLRRADRKDELASDAETTDRPKPFRGEVANLFDVDLAAALRRSREAERRREAQRELAKDRPRDRAWSGSTW